MPKMQEIRGIMGFPPGAMEGPPANHTSTPPSQTSPASEDNLIASPGTTDGGTLSSMLGDSSAASASSSHRTTPVASRSNSNSRHKLPQHPGDIELTEVNNQSRPNNIGDMRVLTLGRKGKADAAALSESLDAAGSRIVTMTGTIKRGKKADETVQVQLQLSQNEINKLTESFMGEKETKVSYCGLGAGPHILLFTFLFMPIAFIISLCMSFYLGTTAWYNLYLYLSEERTIWHKIFLCPLLILFFPFLIVLFSLGIALYGMVIQVCWFWASWIREMKDPEKSFYGWLFGKLQVPQCSPYQIVILDETALSNQTTPAQTTDL